MYYMVCNIYNPITWLQSAEMHDFLLNNSNVNGKKYTGYDGEQLYREFCVFN